MALEEIKLEDTHLHSPPSCRRAHHFFALTFLENVNLHGLVGHQALEARVLLYHAW